MQTEQNEKTEQMPSAPTTSAWEKFSLKPEILAAIKTMGYQQPTPVQSACIPLLTSEARDLLALARTGTGKTAAFGIPLLNRIDTKAGLQSLILCPTRELARQVAESIQSLGRVLGIEVATILGGESYQKQFAALRRNPQVLVSTPGRLVDLMEQKALSLETVEYLILDEADEMLSFGFGEALELIWKSLDGHDYNTWLFSATMSQSIQKIASTHLKTPEVVKLSTTAEPSRVQSFSAIVYEEDKEDALSLLIKSTPEFYGIVFTQTKKQVAELEIKLRSLGLAVDSLHGDKVQADRNRVIKAFKNQEIQILVATDVAARGLDIEDLTHVVNFELPWDVETYTHRIGRTARAGKSGTVWTFVRPKEAYHLRRFENALKFQFQTLQIPSLDQVKKGLMKNSVMNIQKTLIPPSEKRLYLDLILELQTKDALEISPETQDWLMKAMQYFRVASDLKMKQPRQVAPFSGGQSRGGGSDRPRSSSGGGRRDFGGGGGYRNDRGGGNDRGFDRGFDRGPDRSSDRGDRPERSASAGSSERSTGSGVRRDRYADRPRTGPSSDRGFSARRENSDFGGDTGGGFRNDAPARPYARKTSDSGPSRSFSRGPRPERGPRRSED